LCRDLSAIVTFRELMKHQIWLLATILLLTVQNSFSQGPPITVDAPIMLGGKTMVVQSLTEIRSTNKGTFVSIPFTYQYLPTSNSVISVSIPYVNYDFKEGYILGEDFSHGLNITSFIASKSDTLNPFVQGTNFTNGSTLGDISITGKYQLFRKDGTGKTFRIAAKTVQTLPTGEKLNLRKMSTGYYQGYVGFVTAYESLKVGFSNELGYNWAPNSFYDEFVHKLGFGLPLLKPTYPVKQLNLFFEYNGAWMFEQGEYQLLYGEGIQYAKGKFIVEAVMQFPLIQDMPDLEKHKNSVFVGGRYVF